ncbi:MAG: glycosyl hydrolase 53 family protein [Verrucomicrobiales bacterium]|nr:glycosyl hydrolase 53 family protein [Verrucomicrobiales bacterium]
MFGGHLRSRLRRCAQLFTPLLLACTGLGAACGTAQTSGFVAGADMSHLLFFEDRGVVYKDNGAPGDALAILKRRGVNCIRLRLFTGSDELVRTNKAYDYTNNLTYTLPLAARVKSHGLQLMIDFHYSDTWADPGKQTKPAAWAGLSFAELTNAVRAYTSNCIAAFKAAGAMPEYVQLGNEITGGMLWPDGAVGGTNDTPAQWLKFGQLLKSAYRGVADAASNQMPKIIIHIDRGGDWPTAKWFFDKLSQQNVPYDVIGYSFYPWWHGCFSNLFSCLSNTAARYRKPIMVVETAFPWANSTNVCDIAATTNGQVEYVAALAETIHSVPGRPVVGLFWWGTEYQQLWGYQLAGFDRRSFWNTNGNVLPVADAFGQLSAPVKITPALGTDSITFTWPISGAGMVLTASTTVAASVWSPVSIPPIRSGTHYSVTLSMPTGHTHFYRLQAN